MEVNSGVERLLMKTEKYRSLWNTDSKEVTFLILTNHASAPAGKKRLSPSNKIRRETSQKKFAEDSQMPQSKTLA